MTVEPLRTADETAAILRISKKTLMEHVRLGNIAFISVGTGTKRIRRMFAAEDIEAFIRSREIEKHPLPKIQPRHKNAGSVFDFMTISRPAPKPKRRD